MKVTEKATEITQKKENGEKKLMLKKLTRHIPNNHKRELEHPQVQR
jgi:hypothetical protein